MNFYDDARRWPTGAVQSRNTGPREPRQERRPIQLHLNSGNAAIGKAIADPSLPRPAGFLTPLELHIQRLWQCDDQNYCAASGEEKVKKSATCTQCGGTITIVDDDGTFGAWWKGLLSAERQKYLRKQGTHEAKGGGQQKRKGGGDRGKGNQHDHGVANAMRIIRQKWENGEIA